MTPDVALPLALCLVWLIVANGIGMFPWRDRHWRAAFGMVAIGLPVLVWLTRAGGPGIGAVVLVAAGSLLHLPVVFPWRGPRRRVGWSG